ncbi:hypothetical protein M6B38_102495 [Iris pallida]|uniref:Uncharacterized protein n=1 Tax=Iris pallida TaxID=29817 RepID=A0AAX6G6A4_IRIPA|nr:hypothetical protein M6B38_102495 [Iris pallida]
MSDLGVLEPMDLEKPDLSEEMKSSATSLSSAVLVLHLPRARARSGEGHRQAPLRP